MGAADLFEEPFGVSGDLCRGASPAPRRSQHRVRAAEGAEEIDKYSGIEVNAHYTARRWVASSSGVTTWGFPEVTNFFRSTSLVTRKSHSSALLTMRMSFG